MKKERMKILEMIEDGKITADEGERLLGSIPRRYHESDFDAEEFKEKFNKFSRHVEDFSRDLGDKMSAAFKDMEPTLKNATKKAIVHTANAVDEISKYLDETLRKMEARAEDKAGQAKDGAFGGDPGPDESGGDKDGAQDDDVLKF